jgi:ATP-dependent Lhr-like helicase
MGFYRGKTAYINRCSYRFREDIQKVRASILRKPLDILVTTPETLYLMLTSEKAREILRTVEQVVVDEIHYMAGDKRGAHLSLSLERLNWRVRNPKAFGARSRIFRWLGENY